jgi:hypothetical protein
MCEGITCREFDRTRDTVQPLLKLFKGVGLGRAPYHRADRIIASSPPQRAELVDLVYWFVLFIWLVLVQPNKPNRPKKPDQRVSRALPIC